MLSYDSVKELLGNCDKDPSELKMKMAICYPDMAAGDIFDIFKLTCENYAEKSDEIEDSLKFYNSLCAGKSLGQIHQMNIDIKENFHSTYIFRNIHRLLNETDAWEKSVRGKMLLKKLQKLKDEILAKIKKNYRDHRLNDLFEIICEFIELVETKKASLK